MLLGSEGMKGSRCGLGISMWHGRDCKCAKMSPFASRPACHQLMPPLAVVDHMRVVLSVLLAYCLFVGFVELFTRGWGFGALLGLIAQVEFGPQELHRRHVQVMAGGPQVSTSKLGSVLLHWRLLLGAYTVPSRQLCGL